MNYHNVRSVVKYRNVYNLVKYHNVLHLVEYRNVLHLVKYHNVLHLVKYRNVLHLVKYHNVRNLVKYHNDLHLVTFHNSLHLVKYHNVTSPSHYRSASSAGSGTGKSQPLHSYPLKDLHPEDSTQVLPWQVYLPVSARGRPRHHVNGKRGNVEINNSPLEGIEPGASRLKSNIHFYRMS